MKLLRALAVLVISGVAFVCGCLLLLTAAVAAHAVGYAQATGVLVGVVCMVGFHGGIEVANRVARGLVSGRGRTRVE